jgi:hypothetical protein
MFSLLFDYEKIDSAFYGHEVERKIIAEIINNSLTCEIGFAQGDLLISQEIMVPSVVEFISRSKQIHYSLDENVAFSYCQ